MKLRAQVVRRLLALPVTGKDAGFPAFRVEAIRLFMIDDITSIVNGLEEVCVRISSMKGSQESGNSQPFFLKCEEVVYNFVCLLDSSKHQRS